MGLAFSLRETFREDVSSLAVEVSADSTRFSIMIIHRAVQNTPACGENSTRHHDTHLQGDPFHQAVGKKRLIV